MERFIRQFLFYARKFEIFLIIIASVAVPFRMIWIGIDKIIARNPKYWLPEHVQWLMGIGFATIFIHFLLLALNSAVNRDNYFRRIFTKISYLFQSRSTWSIGSSLACLLVGVYFLFPSDGNLANRFQGALSIYFSAIGTTLIVDIFYDKLAPITDVDKLLLSITSDLSDCSESSNVWFVYPALNIGYYRALKRLDKDDETGSKLPNENVYSQFRTTFKNKIFHLTKARAITYPTNLYNSFYHRYEENHNTSINNKRIKACVDEATELFQTKELQTMQIQPVEFPQHVIIIGDLVYTIMSYGLPTFDSTSQTFKGGEKYLASLLVYRKKDPAMAKQISMHLENLCQSKSP